MLLRRVQVYIVFTKSVELTVIFYATLEINTAFIFIPNINFIDFFTYIK